jgi:GTP-binding protein HflX
MVALVGYTNAGKSTLFNRLTGSSAFASPILFATLDPAIKSLRVPNHQMVLISDTVGFIRKLPHELVAAFRATLEEVVQAQLLVHVIDASTEEAEEQIEAVQQTIQDLGAGDKPVLCVLNKMDLLENDRLMLQSFRNRLEHVVAVSAETGTGIEELKEKIVQMLAGFWQRLNLSIPHDQQSLISLLHEQGKIYNKTYVDGHVELDVEIPKKLAEKVRHYSHT